MSPYDLTTLVALKAWLGLPSTASPNDPMLSALVTAASRAVCAWLARHNLLPKTYTEVIDGEGSRVFLRHWPVLSVTSVICNAYALPAVSANVDLTSAYGYLLKPEGSTPPGRQQAVDVFGYAFARGPQTFSITYLAGYAVQSEAQSVPAASPYTLTPQAPYGPWGSDIAVINALNGGALTVVTGTPAPGQYSVAGGIYTFAAGDAGTAIQLSYGYVPQDIAQATLELAAERFRAAEHIGQRSKSIGGQETVSYDPSAISAPVLALLQPYRRVGF